MEAVANIGSALPSIFAPKWTIAGLLAPAEAANPPSSTLTLVQAIGGFVVALTVPMVAAVPDGPHATFMRKVAYCSLGAAELLLAPLLLVKTRQGAASGFATEKPPMIVGGVLVPLMLFRAYALFGNPKLMDSKNEGKEKEK